MEDSSNDKGKVSDSGYTNTVSQSQTNSDSSLSRNSKRSKNSGYYGGNPSTFDASNYALPRPISKRKNKEHKNKKIKTSTGVGTGVTELGTHIKSGRQTDIGSYDDLKHLCNKSEDVARVQSSDVTDLGEHNGDSNSTSPEGGVDTKANPLANINSNNNEGFCTVIALHSGLVIDSTPSLKTTLGYTREEWSGRSFIDFVHPKDKSTFTDHLTKNIALPYGDSDDGLSESQTSLYCCLRKHDDGRSSATGSGSDASNSVLSSSSLYMPFHLTTSIKYYRERTNEDKPRVMFLAITAQPILHIYKAPEETIISTIFSTRHNPNCILTHVDQNVVQYLGYLPQDMIGRSLFDFYHPEDLPFIKDVYETVVKMEGTPFRSKPYRFASHNGGYVVLETEWSSFVNPWKEKLEFVVGHHRILRGPPNPDVFQKADDCQRSLLANVSEKVFKESKIIQGEIRVLLDERIQRTDNIDVLHLSSRSKDLVTFVENLLQEVKPLAVNTKDRSPTDDRSFSEPNGVMHGAILPYREYCDSKSSTETPPSYNQLNYNEKIERFFRSKPFVTAAAYGSDENNIHSSGPSGDDNINSNGPSNDDSGKSRANLTDTKDTTPNSSGGSGSGENLSSGSNNRRSTNYDSRDDSENARSTNAIQPKGFKLPTLTESLLNKHNIDMEKLMAQQHNERRSTKKNNKLLKDSQLNGKTGNSMETDNDPAKNRASKRCSSNSREGQHYKVPKYDENVKTSTATPDPIIINAPVNPTINVNDSQSAMPTDRANINVWPSVGVTMPSQLHPLFCVTSQNSGPQESSKYLALPPMIPVLYVPARMRVDDINSTPQPTSNQFEQNPYASPLATMIYPPMVCTPMLVPPVYRPFVRPTTAPIQQETPQSNIGDNQQENPSDGKRPASQSTSIRALPGSTMAMSESSKKVLLPGEHLSSCVSIDGGCSTLIPTTKPQTNTNSEFESSLEDSSDSSFYGSFLSTTSCSYYNKKNKANESQFKKISWNSRNNDKYQRDLRQKSLPWQDNVKMTNELIYQYQMTPKPLNEVLEADLKALKKFHQPQMVIDQFAQLHSDTELGDITMKFLSMDEISSSDEKNDNYSVMAEVRNHQGHSRPSSNRDQPLIR